MKVINGQRVFVLEIPEAHLAVINEGLMEVKYGRAAPVVIAISQQVRLQKDQTEAVVTELKGDPRFKETVRQ